MHDADVAVEVVAEEDERVDLCGARKAVGRGRGLQRFRRPHGDAAHEALAHERLPHELLVAARPARLGILVDARLAELRAQRREERGEGGARGVLRLRAEQTRCRARPRRVLVRHLARQRDTQPRRLCLLRERRDRRGGGDGAAREEEALARVSETNSTGDMVINWIINEFSQLTVKTR